MEKVGRNLVHTTIVSYMYSNPIFNAPIYYLDVAQFLEMGSEFCNHSSLFGSLLLLGSFLHELC